MFKWFHNLTTGDTDYSNETSSLDSYVEVSIPMEISTTSTSAAVCG
ncbi:MAG: hypothetical protein MJZ24_05600 [Paludibacteraceae bacterium]|nr:hypothetical protein [Paludibacteraceae bacterium]